MAVVEVQGAPCLAALWRRDPKTFPFLLETVAVPPSGASYDLLLADCGESIELRGGRTRRAGVETERDFFESLNAAAHAVKCPPFRELPFCGGWFVYLGYEAAAHAEPTLRLPASPHGLPDALAVRCRSALIRDHRSQRTWAVSELGRQRAAELAAMPSCDSAADSDLPVPLETLQDAGFDFTSGVLRIKEYLRAGDAFQVNLSRRWQVTYPDPVDAGALYARLRRSNPAPFAGAMEWGGCQLLSSSPERLVRVTGDTVRTSPIAGTHARHGEAELDARSRAQLAASLKERSEHVMLVDLERNDLGRICRAGSVRAEAMMRVESFAHVHHIVSDVVGTLRRGLGAGDVLRAVFPGGTITGCPKVRAMQIIAELEGRGRGPYTGSMGYLSRCGTLDLNILIRTLVVEGTRVTLNTGAGIVADSDPAQELAETRAKARGPLLALGVAP